MNLVEKNGELGYFNTKGKFIKHSTPERPTTDSIYDAKNGSEYRYLYWFEHDVLIKERIIENQYAIKDFFYDHKGNVIKTETAGYKEEENVKRDCFCVNC